MHYFILFSFIFCASMQMYGMQKELSLTQKTNSPALIDDLSDLAKDKTEEETTPHITLKPHKIAAGVTISSEDQKHNEYLPMLRRAREFDQKEWQDALKNANEREAAYWKKEYDLSAQEESDYLRELSGDRSEADTLLPHVRSQRSLYSRLLEEARKKGDHALALRFKKLCVFYTLREEFYTGTPSVELSKSNPEAAARLMDNPIKEESSLSSALTTSQSIPLVEIAWHEKSGEYAPAPIKSESREKKESKEEVISSPIISVLSDAKGKDEEDAPTHAESESITHDQCLSMLQRQHRFWKKEWKRYLKKGDEQTAAYWKKEYDLSKQEKLDYLRERSGDRSQSATLLPYIRRQRSLYGRMLEKAKKEGRLENFYKEHYDFYTLRESLYTGVPPIDLSKSNPTTSESEARLIDSSMDDPMKGKMLSKPAPAIPKSVPLPEITWIDDKQFIFAPGEGKTSLLCAPQHAWYADYWWKKFWQKNPLEQDIFAERGKFPRAEIASATKGLIAYAQSKEQPYDICFLQAYLPERAAFLRTVATGSIITTAAAAVVNSVPKPEFMTKGVITLASTLSDYLKTSKSWFQTTRALINGYLPKPNEEEKNHREVRQEVYNWWQTHKGFEDDLKKMHDTRVAHHNSLVNGYTNPATGESVPSIIDTVKDMGSKAKDFEGKLEETSSLNKLITATAYLAAGSDILHRLLNKRDYYIVTIKPA